MNFVAENTWLNFVAGSMDFIGLAQGPALPMIKSKFKIRETNSITKRNVELNTIPIQTLQHDNIKSRRLALLKCLYYTNTKTL